MIKPKTWPPHKHTQMYSRPHVHIHTDKKPASNIQKHQTHTKAHTHIQKGEARDWRKAVFSPQIFQQASSLLWLRNDSINCGKQNEKVQKSRMTKLLNKKLQGECIINQIKFHIINSITVMTL